MLLAAFFFSLLALPLVWRFAFRTPDSIAATLAAYARKNGYRTSADPTEIEAVIDDVAVRLSGATVPTTMWTAEATAIAKVDGWVRVRPKDEKEPAGLRVGHLEFDTCFFVEGSSRECACKVLTPELQKLLLAFGRRGQTKYESGAFTFSWEDAQGATNDLDDAIAIAVAACRMPARDGLYRD